MYDYTDQTALITGASSGIGAEFARHLARRGANLVLVARRIDRLQTLAQELTEVYGVSVKVIARDLSRTNAGRSLAHDLRRRGLTIDALINNAGFGTYGPVAEENEDALSNEIAVNVTALTELTRGLLPGMLERDRGVIINVSSVAAFQPLPALAIYSATKSYVLSFTEALWGETEKTGVRVSALCPGPTDTEFFDLAGTEPTTGKPKPVGEVVTAALSAIDRRKPRVITDGKLAFASVLVKFIPRKALIRIGRKAMSGSRRPQQ